jgi:hypothetical protein
MFMIHPSEEGEGVEAPSMPKEAGKYTHHPGSFCPDEAFPLSGLPYFMPSAFFSLWLMQFLNNIKHISSCGFYNLRCSHYISSSGLNV